MDAEVRESLAVPMAMSRRPEAFEFLLEVMRGAPEPLALAAVEALAMYRSDAALRARVAEAVAGRNLAIQRKCRAVWV